MKKTFYICLIISCLFVVIAGSPAFSQDNDPYTEERRAMVEDTIKARGVKDEKVLGAMRTVPRHLFVPSRLQRFAYQDSPLPIGSGQTISQPYIVALMTELADVDEDDTVFEVGAGSGYQAAVLSVLVKEVYTVEYIESLGREAEKRLKELGYNNVTVRVGDGYKGWPEHAPFDAIVVTAGIDHIPQPLLDQLKPGGRMVIPVGETLSNQNLRVIEKDEHGQITEHNILPVRFVPFLGPNAEKPR